MALQKPLDFWLALREHLISDGWKESVLEPALFYHRDEEGVLNGILITHVDDLEGGVRPGLEEKLFQKSSQSLDFATNHRFSFTFRGREIKQSEKKDEHGNVCGGYIDVCMRNYALSMSKITVSKERRAQPEADLTEEEQRILNSGAGELGWISRQLRSDLAFDNGCVQRCKKKPKVSDLLRLKTVVEAARRGADVRMRFWDDVDLQNGVILHLADSGHANGTPEHDQIKRYRSIGGYYILIANPEVLEGKPSRANILAFNSSQTKRVCRSTLAAEASHLSESIECGDWIIVVLHEALHGSVDLRNWTDVIQQRKRIYVTDARSVFDYLHKEACSTSSDKRMAIEGALLRETVRKEGADVRWIDGQQNMANVLTKVNTDKTILNQFLRDGLFSLIQTDANRQQKLKQQIQRKARKAKEKNNECENQQFPATTAGATSPFEHKNP